MKKNIFSKVRHGRVGLACLLVVAPSFFFLLSSFVALNHLYRTLAGQDLSPEEGPRRRRHQTYVACSDALGSSQNFFFFALIVVALFLSHAMLS